MKTFYYNRNETNDGNGSKGSPFKYVNSLIKAVNASDDTEFICYALNSIKPSNPIPRNDASCFFYHDSRSEAVDLTVRGGKTLTLSVDSSVDFTTYYLWYSNRTTSGTANTIKFSNIVFDAANKCENCYTDYNYGDANIRPTEFSNCTFTNSKSYAITSCDDGKNINCPLRYFYDCTITNCNKCVYCYGHETEKVNRFWFYRSKFLNCSNTSLFCNESVGGYHSGYAILLFDTCLFYNLKGTSNIFYNRVHDNGCLATISLTHCTMCNITLGSDNNACLFETPYYWSNRNRINIDNSIILWNNTSAKLVRGYNSGRGGWTYVNLANNILTSSTCSGCTVESDTNNITGYGNQDLNIANTDNGFPYYFNKDISSLTGNSINDAVNRDNNNITYFLKPYNWNNKYWYINKIDNNWIERPATGFYKGASVMPKSWSISDVKAVNKTGTDILTTTDKSIWSNDTLTVSAVFTQDSSESGLFPNTGKANCIITLTDIAGKSFTLNSNVVVESGNSVSFGEINISKLKEFGTLQKYNIQISFELTPDYE